jgi:hypothetical protein
MFDRILNVNLDEFDKLTERFKWRFYEILDENQIRVEVPKGDTQNLVLTVSNTQANKDKLESMGFIKQDIKNWRDWN